MALVRSMMHPTPDERPTVDQILQQRPMVKQAGLECNEFLRDYIHDVETCCSEPGAAAIRPRHSQVPLSPVPIKRSLVVIASPKMAGVSPQMFCSPETTTCS
jgi:hypothetical protein